MVNEFTRFIAVGVVNTLVGLAGTFIFRYGLGFSYWPATLFGLMVGGMVSFLLNRSFTFRSERRMKEALPRFIAVVSICYLLAYRAGLQVGEAAGYALGLGAEASENIAVFVGMGCYTVINYIGQKKIVFRHLKLRQLDEEPVR